MRGRGRSIYSVPFRSIPTSEGRTHPSWTVPSRTHPPRDPPPPRDLPPPWVPAWVTRHIPHSTCHMPHSTCHIPHATFHSTFNFRHSTFHIPHSTYHFPHATCHTPHATCHMPHATLHMPHVTFHMPHPTFQNPPTFHSTFHCGPIRNTEWVPWNRVENMSQAVSDGKETHSPQYMHSMHCVSSHSTHVLYPVPWIQLCVPCGPTVEGVEWRMWNLRKWDVACGMWHVECGM